MMRFYRVGNRVLNMAMLIDAQYSAEKERLELVFSGPSPVRVIDVGSVEAYEVVLKGVEAADCWEWIACQATPVR
jgi:hypothetical protein